MLYAAAGHIPAHQRLHASEARQAAGLGGGFLADTGRLTVMCQAITISFVASTPSSRQPCHGTAHQGRRAWRPLYSFRRPHPLQQVFALFDEALQQPTAHTVSQATATEEKSCRGGVPTAQMMIVKHSGQPSMGKAAGACRARLRCRPERAGFAGYILACCVQIVLSWREPEHRCFRVLRRRKSSGLFYFLWPPHFPFFSSMQSIQ